MMKNTVKKPVSNPSGLHVVQITPKTYGVFLKKYLLQRFRTKTAATRHLRKLQAKVKKNPASAATLAKAAIGVFDANSDGRVTRKDVRILRKASRPKSKVQSPKRKAPAKRKAARRNPIDPIMAFAAGASGILSALQIKAMVNKRKAKRGTTKAKTNPGLFPGDAYMQTIKFADGRVRSVHVIDSRTGKAIARYKTAAAAKSYATKNGIRLEVNPKLKPNGIVSRFAARRKAKKEYAKELRLSAEIDRSRTRRKAAESKAKANPPNRKIVHLLAYRGGKFHHVACGGSIMRNGTRDFADVTCKKCLEHVHYQNRVKREAERLDREKAAKRKNPKTTTRRRTYEMFQGRKAENMVAMPVSIHAPAKMDQLGDLIELKLTNGQTLKLNPKKFKLCAANGRLWITGGTFAKANPAEKANVLNPIAEIDHVVYGTFKPHHGDHNYTHFIHKLGEESGHKPILAVDREGFPVIRGGKYKIEARGIVN